MNTQFSNSASRAGSGRLASLLLCVVMTCVVPAMAFAASSFMAPSQAQTMASSDAFTMMPGVVVDPGAKVVFSMHPDGGVEALALDSGRVLWTSDAAAQPLAVYGTYLIAQVEPTRRGVLEIAFLDPARDGAAALVTSIELPETVAAMVDDGIGVRFAANVTFEGGAPVVGWAYEKVRVTGAMPELVPGADQVERFSGRVRFDAASASWTAVAGASRALEAQRPDLSDAERLADLAGTQFHSADRGFVMTSERVADGRVFERYRWTLHARADGARRGEIRTETSFAPHFVADSTLVRESRTHQKRVGGEIEELPRRLVAVDISSGREAWTRAVRDTAYRGPFPP